MDFGEIVTLDDTSLNAVAGKALYMSHHRKVFNIINLTNWQQVRAFCE